MHSLFELPFQHATRRRRPPGGCRRACIHLSRPTVWPARWPWRRRTAPRARLLDMDRLAQSFSRDEAGRGFGRPSAEAL